MRIELQQFTTKNESISKLRFRKSEKIFQKVNRCQDLLIQHRLKKIPSPISQTAACHSTAKQSNEITMRSFNQKIPLLEFLLAELDINFSCIVISENWFSSNTSLNKYDTDGYNLSCNGGGGICVYVMNSLEAEVTDLRLVGAESVLIRTFCDGRPVCSVLTAYWTPSSRGSAFFIDLGVHLPSPIKLSHCEDLNFDLNPEN